VVRLRATLRLALALPQTHSSGRRSHFHTVERAPPAVTGVNDSINWCDRLPAL
jgi:hypothetical protein